MLTEFRERYGRTVGRVLAVVSGAGLLVYLLATPVRGTIIADRPGQPPLVEHSWSTGGLVLSLLAGVALVLTVAAAVLSFRGRPARVRPLLLAAGLLALVASPVVAVLALVAAYLIGGAGGHSRN